MYILLIALPLISFCVTGLFGKHIGPYGSASISISSACFSFLLSVLIIYEVLVNYCCVYIKLLIWIDSGSLNLNWGFMFDSLTAIMCCIITFISFLVHLYSIEYMGHDPHLPRFLAYLSLFTFFMLIVF